MDAQKQKIEVEQYAVLVLGWLRTRAPQTLSGIAAGCRLPSVQAAREVVEQLVARGLVVGHGRRYAPAPKRLRTCLGCDQPFSSEGPWNRLCGECRDRNPGKQRYKTAFPR